MCYTLEPRTYQALAIAQGLDFFAKTGVKINRSYSVKNMLFMTAKITGQKFARKDLAKASAALRAFAEAQR